jgi:hypothetical protein
MASHANGWLHQQIKGYSGKRSRDLGTDYTNMAPAKLQARQWKYNNLRSETYLLVEAKFCLKCSEDAQPSSHRNHLSSDNIQFIIRCAYHATPKSEAEKKNGTHPGGENQPTEW